MEKTYKDKLSKRNINPNWYLIMGIATISASHMSFSINIIAWIATVPFLLYLSNTKGWKSRLLFILALIIAWSFVVLKIISPPIPYLMIFLFSIPISIFHLPAYLIWDKFKNNKWSILLFPAILTITEWIQYTFTPFASWGVAAYTQMHSLSIMQSLSLFGMPGLSFLIYWVNISILLTILHKKVSIISFYSPILILLILIIFGSLRIEMSNSKGVETLTVAAVGTYSEVSGLPLPTEESNEKIITDLLARTKIAANTGAKLVVWNEASFFTYPKYEGALNNSISLLAKDLNIYIIPSYVMLLSEEPFRYENKYLFINHQGEIEYSYLKHQPVPGEPAIKGTEALEITNISNTKIGGAICYDYDFPYLAKELGKLNADIVVLPSSDWRGIDPIHTQMAAFRAVEQGHSILRSTSFGLSAAITPYGEMTYQMSSFDINSRIMIAELPVKGIKTIYSRIGDTFIYLCFAFLGFFIASHFLVKNHLEALNHCPTTRKELRNELDKNE